MNEIDIRTFFKYLNLTEEFIQKTAIHTKFKLRLRKLSSLKFVFLILNSSIGKRPSFSDLASNALLFFDIKISKQALHKALGKDKFSNFVQKLFKRALCMKMNNLLENNCCFKRIIVQDSTIIKAPINLFSIFSGIANHSAQVANSRIQLAIDLQNLNVELFSIDSYSINDLKAADKLNICKNDLVLRDRGYFKVLEIERIIEQKADFIYRYFDRVKYYSVDGKEIDLLKILITKNFLDIKVRVGKPYGPIIRLIAQPMSDKAVNERVRKLKKDAKHTPSERSIKLQKWSIYLTTLFDSNVWTYNKIFKLYGLRWRIEIIFKAIKSFINLKVINKMSSYQFYSTIYIKFLLFIIILKKIYARFGKELNLSFLKICQQIQSNKNLLVEIVINLSRTNVNQNKYYEWLKYHCCYEKRIIRKNYNEEIEEIFLS